MVKFRGCLRVTVIEEGVYYYLGFIAGLVLGFSDFLWVCMFSVSLGFLYVGTRISGDLHRDVAAH
jgi:hypothetical protein